MAKSAFSNLQKILTGKGLCDNTKLGLTKCYVWPILTYACATWTLIKETENKINASEMSIEYL